ncbi:hypothetical protein BCV70DRAFT_117822 [Testicularia cyperi]|uniref:Uncharacterized protein n=1 Tax=Testicularia cyperi TaxID=1882483 RepID=A0A317XQ37_9BASI|nr:hypothetical protein BCV70DRAFT_117822 [Testicularia cyperi]
MMLSKRFWPPESYHTCNYPLDLDRDLVVLPSLPSEFHRSKFAPSFLFDTHVAFTTLIEIISRVTIWPGLLGCLVRTKPRSEPAFLPLRARDTGRANATIFDHWWYPRSAIASPNVATPQTLRSSTTHSSLINTTHVAIEACMVDFEALYRSYVALGKHLGFQQVERALSLTRRFRT